MVRYHVQVWFNFKFLFVGASIARPRVSTDGGRGRSSLRRGGACSSRYNVMVRSHVRVWFNFNFLLVGASSARPQARVKLSLIVYPLFL